MLHSFKKLLLCMMFVILSGCVSVTPSQKAPYNQKMSWKNRQQQIQTITHWKIQGAMSVRTPKQSGIAYINWQQNNNSYQIHVFGPMGIASTKIQGDLKHVIMTTASHQRIFAKTPETLLENQLGWRLPVTNLKDWIRGLPIENQPSQITFDRYHHITKLEQAGWTIRYLQYTAAYKTDLPSKIDLSYPDLKIRIIINQW